MRGLESPKKFNVELKAGPGSISPVEMVDFNANSQALIRHPRSFFRGNDLVYYDVEND